MAIPCRTDCSHQICADYGKRNLTEQRGKVIVCRCGRELVCVDFTNTCDCGRDYNWAGQELAPRSQWGEETGETADEILQAQAAGFPGFGTDEYD